MGSNVGSSVVGLFEGDSVGVRVGLLVGLRVGDSVGLSVGSGVGFAVVGLKVGASVAKRKAEMLDRSEKLILQSGFRQPMHLRIPYPTWAMNPNEVNSTALAFLPEESDDLPIGN